MAHHHIPNRPVIRCPTIISAGLINNLITEWTVVWIWKYIASAKRVNSTVSASHRCSLMDALCTPPRPNLRTTCLFGCWSQPSVFVPNCPLTQRYITGPTHCYLPGTFPFCGGCFVLSYSILRKQWHRFLFLKHQLLFYHCNLGYLSLLRMPVGLQLGTALESSDLNAISSSFTSNGVKNL